MAENNLNKDNLPLDDEWISRLMEGKLSEEEEAVFLSNGEDQEMLADSIEGLQQFGSLNKAQKQAIDINRQLLDQLKTKPKKLSRHTLSMSTLIWITLIFIIILALLAHYLIRLRGQ